MGLFAFTLLIIYAALVVETPESRAIVVLGLLLLLFLVWLTPYSFRHRFDRLDVDESQIVRVRADVRLALRWDEIVEVREDASRVTVTLDGGAPDHALTLKCSAIEGYYELLMHIHRHCPAARRIPDHLEGLPRVLLPPRCLKGMCWAIPGFLLVFLGLGTLLAGEPPVTTLFAVVAGFFLAFFVPFYILLPSAMIVTTEGVVVNYAWRSRTLRHDEIDEIVLARPGVKVRSGGKSYSLLQPRDGPLTACNILLTAWEAARQGEDKQSDADAAV
jgi:hypothetical protein